MNGLRCWIAATWWITRYFLYRKGIGSLPLLSDVYPETMTVVGHVLRWGSRIRIRGAEHCPRHGPAAFAANHFKFDDPPVMFRVIYLGSGNNIYPHFLGRDDIFAGAPLANLIDYNEVLELTGGVLFTRESVKLSQLKPIVKVLRDGGCFALYPGRKRSRSGVIMEYPDENPEPGGVALFVGQAQRGRPDLRIPVVPLARTYNPVTKKSAFVFGEPDYLPPDADRAQRAELDCRVAERIAQLAEIDVLQIVCGILCMRAIHNRHEAIALSAFEEAVRQVVDSVPKRNVDPAVETRLGREVKGALKYLRKKGMLRLTRDQVVPDLTAIQSDRPITYEFRDENPVKYTTNQILHCFDVIRAVETVALEL
ncbi:MAG: hypothetical protein GY851_04060 [bacterium]|nr:hypothetical protein [bacterium]